MPAHNVDDLRERIIDRHVVHRGAFIEFRVDTVERALHAGQQAWEGFLLVERDDREAECG